LKQIKLSSPARVKERSATACIVAAVWSRASSRSRRSTANVRPSSLNYSHRRSEEIDAHRRVRLERAARFRFRDWIGLRLLRAISAARDHRSALWVIRQACQNIGEPSLDRCRRPWRCEQPPAVTVGTGEGQAPPADGDGTQVTLGSVVGHAQAAILEDAGELGPAIEAMVDGFYQSRCSWGPWRAARATSSQVASPTFRSITSTTKCKSPFMQAGRDAAAGLPA
jgi:hypothetical protein